MNVTCSGNLAGLAMFIQIRMRDPYGGQSTPFNRPTSWITELSMIPAIRVGVGSGYEIRPTHAHKLPSLRLHLNMRVDVREAILKVKILVSDGKSLSTVVIQARSHQMIIVDRVVDHF